MDFLRCFSALRYLLCDKLHNWLNYTTWIDNVIVQVATVVSAPPAPVNRASSLANFNDGGAREFLAQQKWPPGLQETFINNVYKIAYRVFICDDSGSMAATDGNRLLDTNGHKQLVSCSRWTELTEALKFHATLARTASTPTEFRLLNGAPPILLGTPDDVSGERYNNLLSLFQQSPNGGTPLCFHIREVVNEIRGMEQSLRANGHKALVVIATDGESSDGDIAEAMRPLKDLPVWVVIRLCTDEAPVVKYWNDIDYELELDMDVIDDLCGEAAEIYRKNPFLSYGEPLHRLREFGCSVKELDLLDETTLSLEQIRRLAATIFGGTDDSYPHPEADWKGFLAAVDAENKKIPEVWNAMYKRNKPWFLLDKLAKQKKGGKCAIM